MRISVDTSKLNVSGKYFSWENPKEGINTLFKYKKVFNRGRSEWETCNLYIYIYNGEIIMNATSIRKDSCERKFDQILNAKGDYSKVNFECCYPLEII